MSAQLQSGEDNSADYIYIDSENRVHLLVPVVAGDSIGIDNTCQAAKELQTFFYGGEKSALSVLIKYAQKLELELSSLDQQSAPAFLISQKQDRWDQIQRYIAMLKLLGTDLGINNGRSYPTLPHAVHSLLAKKTNCLTVFLCPKEHDFFLRTSSPTFSLIRQDRNVFWDTHEHDNYTGFGPKLRHCIQEKLDDIAEPTSSSSNKENIINAIVSDFQGQTNITLKQLQEYTAGYIQQEYNKTVDLKISQYPSPVTGSYVIDDLYLNEMGMPYSEDEIEESLSNILGFALQSDFFDSINNTKLIELGAANDIDRINKVSIAIQFFLAHINLYCKAKNLSSIDFGSVLEKKRTEIAECIASSLFSKDVKVEDELFNIIDRYKKEFGLSESLSLEEKKHIKAEFSLNYSIIKDSPHFDEFMFFREDVPGDFFNHRNRISIHFIDFINHSPSIPSSVRDIAASFQKDLVDLKASNVRKLEHNNEAALQNERVYRDRIAMKLLIPPGKTYDDQKFSDSNLKWALNVFRESITGYKNKLLYSFKRKEKKDWLFELETICKTFSETIETEFKCLGLVRTIIDLNRLRNTIEATRAENHRTKPSTLVTIIKNFNDKLNTLFELEDSLIASHPDAPMKYLLEFEQSKLDINTYPALHQLETKWYSDKAIEIIKALPTGSYNYKTVSFLNTKNPDDFDTFVLDALNADASSGNIPEGSFLERLNFIFSIKEKDCLPDIKDKLLKLNKPWWNHPQALEILIPIISEESSPKMIDFLNFRPPELLNVEILRGAIIQLSKNKNLKVLSLVELEETNRRYMLLGKPAQNNMILYELDDKWWSNVNIRVILEVPPACYNQHLIQFLNSINPDAMTDTIKLGLRKWDGNSPILLDSFYSSAETSQINPGITNENSDPIISQLEEVKKKYAVHAKKKLFSLFSNTMKKNVIISREFEIIKGLYSLDKNIDLAIKKIEILKFFLELKFKSWFFFCLFSPTSTRILEKLITDLKTKSNGTVAEPIRHG